jgi:hypothetical protein
MFFCLCYMPVVRSKDSNGPFYRWGQRGAKYYYVPGSGSSKERAKGLAAAQGRAIAARRHSSGGRRRR